MADTIDKPHLITRPIQLLAAWLVGLSVIDASFLGAAKLMGTGSWECGALVCASIANVPAFILALFLLQTRFRPEMQADTFYAEYISKKTGNSLQVNREERLERQIDELRNLIFERNQVSAKKALSLEPISVSINDYIPFYKDLRQALDAADIQISSVFGKANRVEEPPKQFIVAISDDLSIEQVVPVLRVCSKFPFDGYRITERLPEVGDDEDFYLGAYGGFDRIRPFTPELIFELDHSPDDKLTYLLR